MTQLVNQHQSTGNKSQKPKTRIPDKVDFNESTMTAIWFAQRGFRVFPCRPNKSPYVKNWKTANFTVAQIHLWMKEHPNTFWGISCDQGFSVFDFDTHKPSFKASKESQEFLDRCKDKCTIRQRTLNNGYHFFVRDVLKNKINLLPGVDQKGPGGYIILYHNPLDITFITLIKKKLTF